MLLLCITDTSVKLYLKEYDINYRLHYIIIIVFRSQSAVTVFIILGKSPHDTPLRKGINNVILIYYVRFYR